MKPLSLDEINHLSEVAYLYQPNNDGKQFPRLLDTARLYWAEKEKNQKLAEYLLSIKSLGCTIELNGCPACIANEALKFCGEDE